MEEINLKMTSVTVKADTRALRVKWTRELGDDVDMSESIADKLERWQKKVNREEKFKDLLDGNKQE